MIKLHAIYSRILVNLLVKLSRTLVNLLVNTVELTRMNPNGGHGGGLPSASSSCRLGPGNTLGRGSVFLDTVRLGYWLDYWLDYWLGYWLDYWQDY